VPVTDSPPPWCEHEPGIHDGEVPSHATAPEKSRAWLLIEFDGPWAEHAAESKLPEPLDKLAVAADELGIRVQLLRRPGGRDTPGEHIYAAWTGEPEPWLVRVGAGGLDLTALATGSQPAGEPADGLYLVCVHGRRNRCCAKFGIPITRALVERHPDRLWETTHLGGHRFAVNLALLPHGLYYGPVDLAAATAAIEAYERGQVIAHRYRGRAGYDVADQLAEHAVLEQAGSLALQPAPVQAH
jgi:hypothetical protein